MSKSWTEKEVEALKREYGKVPTFLICLAMKRTPKAVRRKAAKLGLKIRKIDSITYFNRRIVISENQLNNSPCWDWTGYKDEKGYGRIYKEGLNKYAHRYAYEHFVGPIPDNLEIDHLCRRRCCVNPEHLEAVTHRVNVARGTSPSAKYIVLNPHT
jgi:hypothetical protein